MHHVEENGDVVHHIVQAHGITARWAKGLDDGGSDCKHCALRQVNCSRTPCGLGFYRRIEDFELGDLTDEERTSLVTQALMR